MKKIKVKIAVPSAKAPEPETLMAVSYLMAYSLVNSHLVPEGLSVNLDVRQSSLLPDLRNNFILDAIKDGNDYLLFIDDDMNFPPELLIELLSHRKPIIGCNCVTKNETHSKFTAIGLDYKILPTLPKDTGIQEISALGTGIMLIDLSIFKKLKMPYFFLHWCKKNKRMFGEDYYFCGKAIEKKIKIFVHHDLSRQTFHIGKKSYSINHAIQCFINNGLLSKNSLKVNNRKAKRI